MEIFKVERRLITMNPGGYDVTESRFRKPNDVLHSLGGTANFVTTRGTIAMICKLYMHGLLLKISLAFISWSKAIGQGNRPIGNTPLTQHHRSFTHD